MLSWRAPGSRSIGGTVRILITAVPMFGHVNPMISLALAARRAGHEVVVASGPEMSSYIESYGLSAWSVGPTNAEGTGTRSGWFPPPGSDISWYNYFAASGGQRAADLLPRVEQWPPDLVICEATEMGGRVVAALTGVPFVVHGLIKAPTPSVWASYEWVIGQLVEKWSLACTVEDLVNTTHLEPCPPALQRGHAWPNAIPIRPELPLAPGDAKLPEWFDALPHTETVLLTLGTVYHHRREFLQMAIRDLQALPLNVVVAAGPGADPASFGPQPENVRIEPLLPYPLIMPRCRLIVSQGGTGGTLMALAHGLPLVLLPQGADQSDYSWGVAQAGAAIFMAPEEIVPGAVAAAAERVFGEPSFMAAAGRIRAEIEAMPDPDTVIGMVTNALPAPIGRGKTPTA